MTPEQMTELAARLRKVADQVSSLYGVESDARLVFDLRDAADLIESMAQRVPLSDEQIDKALQTAPHAILVLADRSHLTSAAFKDVLRRLARTIEQAHGIRIEK